MSTNATYSAGVVGGAVKRIRNPHNNDVLSGRGGGINGHAGNVRFRAWVAERKNDYNLAPNKAEKARVAREVIAIVQGQAPPGRFLQRDPTSVGGISWWIELDDDKMMAKTSQALREGAPQIRAAHKDESRDPIRPRVTMKPRSRAVRKPTVSAVTTTTTIPTTISAQRLKRKIGYVEPEETPPIFLTAEAKARAVAELQANLYEAAHETPGIVEEPDVRDDDDQSERAGKRIRMYDGQPHVVIPRPTDVTPPLPPVAPSKQVVPLDPALMPEPLVMNIPAGGGLKRVHSLALSDFSYSQDNVIGDFVNPFENESDLETKPFPPSPRPGVLRQTSIASDLGGYGALFKTDIISSPKNSKMQHGTSSTSDSSSGKGSGVSFGNLSTRSLTSVLSDLPDASSSRPQETDFTEGMKTIFDALHPDQEDETIPTHLFPYRGARRHNSITNRLYGRQ